MQAVIVCPYAVLCRAVKEEACHLFAEQQSETAVNDDLCRIESGRAVCSPICCVMLVMNHQCECSLFYFPTECIHLPAMLAGCQPSPAVPRSAPEVGVPKHAPHAHVQHPVRLWHVLEVDHVEQRPEGGACGHGGQQQVLEALPHLLHAAPLQQAHVRKEAHVEGREERAVVGDNLGQNLRRSSWGISVPAGCCLMSESGGQGGLSDVLQALCS